MLETEYKSLLTKSEYEKIAAHFTWDSIFTQTNHYYGDADGILEKNRIMLRVREKDGGSVIQVKLHKNAGSPLQICEELEFPASGVPDTIVDGEKYIGIKTGELQNLGCTVTKRHSKMWDEKTEICLDKTEYLGTTDYELEIEYIGGGIPPGLHTELDMLGIEFKAASVGKYTRFLNRAREINRPD